MSLAAAAAAVYGAAVDGAAVDGAAAAAAVGAAASAAALTYGPQRGVALATPCTQGQARVPPPTPTASACAPCLTCLCVWYVARMGGAERLNCL